MTPRTCFSTLSCPDWSFQNLIRNGVDFGFDGVEIRLLQRETNLLAHADFQPGELAARRREVDAREPALVPIARHDEVACAGRAHGAGSV